MSPNCERCDRGEHNLCDEPWCECRKTHGVDYKATQPDVTQLQYRLVLDDLSPMTATFTWHSGRDGDTPVLLVIPRALWTQMGRPSTLTMNATP
jgi:hypothetical protein